MLPAIRYSLLRCFVLATAAILIADPRLAAGQELIVGSPAPPLRPAEWIKGGPWDESARGQVRVVDFWSSWCVMCRATIAHVSKLARQYRGSSDVAFVGVSVWESEDADVAGFVREMGDRIEYRVALDQPRQRRRPEAETVSARWLRSAWRIGIPATFIVGRDGRIAWIGHPFDLAEPLERIVNGTWNSRDAQESDEDARETQRTIGRLESKLQRALVAKDRSLTTALFQDLTALQPGFRFEYGMREAEVLANRFRDPQAMAAVLDRLERFHPERAIEIHQKRFFWETDVFRDGPKAAAAARRLLPKLRGLKDEAGLLNRLAWRLVDPDEAAIHEPDLALAQTLAERAVLVSRRDPMILDTLALICFERGDAIAARDLQREAVDRAKTMWWSFDPRMQERLAQFEAAAQSRSRGRVPSDPDD